MASVASELPPGRNVTAGIIIVGDEILKVCLELTAGKGVASLTMGSVSDERRGIRVGSPLLTKAGPWSEPQQIGGKMTLLLLSFFC